MKRIIVLVICLLIALPSLALANEKPRVGVITVCGPIIRNDKTAMTTLEQGQEKQFNKLLYTFVPESQLRQSTLDFYDRKHITEPEKITREELLEFAKEQKIDYILWTRVTGKAAGTSAGFFSVSAKYVMVLDVKYLDVNNDKSLFLGNITADAKGATLPRIINDGMPKLMQKFAEQFKPDELVK